MLATTLVLFLAAQNDLGDGTQPGTLSIPLQDDATCAGCHSSTTVPDLPTDTYRGSMMQLASQDPFFLAAWEIAFDDDPEVAGLCLRCHFPKGYVADRHQPHDGSSLQTSDKEGIACDVCHRAVPPEPTDVADPLSGLLLSNTQLFFDDGTKKYGPYDDALSSGHAVEGSPLFTDSRLCAHCHEVTNTLLPRVGLDNVQISSEMPIERTYTEWKNSAYAVPGAEFKSCMDCHMAALTGVASDVSDSPTRTIRSHRLVGGNTLAPKMMEWLATQPGADARLVAAAPALDEIVDDALVNLQERSATLETVSASVADGTLTVRVTNLTGHKLPTGYAEGRRMFLASTARAANGTVTATTGTVNPATHVMTTPPAHLWAIDLAVDGAPSFHFALVDQVALDSRIPPKGFRATTDTTPVGATVQLQGDGTYAHWDDVEVPLGDTDCWPIVVDVLLQYQTASGEYLQFLVDNAPDYGPTLQAAWNAVGGGAPVTMRALRVAVHLDGTVEPAAASYPCEAPPVDDDAGTIVEPPDPDAGTTTPPTPTVDAGSAVEPEPECACTTTGDAPAGAAVLVGVAAVALRRRRR